MILLAQFCESYLYSSAVWSLAGFGGGYLVGRAHGWLRDRKRGRRDRTS